MEYNGIAITVVILVLISFFLLISVITLSYRVNRIARTNLIAGDLYNRVNYLQHKYEELVDTWNKILKTDEGIAGLLQENKIKENEPRKTTTRARNKSGKFTKKGNINTTSTGEV